MKVPPSKRNPKLYEYQRQRDIRAGRPRKVSVAPTRRKLQALCAMGISKSDVAKELGISQQSISKIFHRPERIHRDTAQRVDEVYRRWEARVPPDTPWSRRTRTLALKQGWKPPFAWEDIDRGILAEEPEPEQVEKPKRIPYDRFDLEEVESFLQSGDWKRPLSPLEKREVMRRWKADGRTERSLCTLTGWRPGRYSQPTTT